MTTAFPDIRKSGLCGVIACGNNILDMNFLSVKPEKYFWRHAITDLLVGVATVGAVVAGAIKLGGFSFMLPWAIVTPLALCLAGFLRALSPGNAWAKAIAISIPIVLATALSLEINDANILVLVATKLIIGLIAVVSVAGGIWFRRYVVNRVRDGDIDHSR